MPKKYKVTDSSTGKTYTFDWNGAQPPTDADLDEIFGAAQPQPEPPLTRQRGPHGGEGNMVEHPHAKIGRAVTENLPMIGGIAGGLAAAPFTGGMSAIPAIALAAGGAALGGVAGSAGRAGLNTAMDVPDEINTPGALAQDMLTEGALQGGSQALGGALTKGVGKVLSKGAGPLYNLALRPGMEGLESRFPGVTKQGLAKAGIENSVGISGKGAAKAGSMIQISEGGADAAVKALPKGTTVPMKPIMGVGGAAKPAIKEAQMRGNAAVKPVFKHVKGMGASHGDQVTPEQLLNIQRAVSRGAGSEAGVMPLAGRPTPTTMPPNLKDAANRLMAGSAQDTLEGMAPELVDINQGLPTQHALRAAIEAAIQRPALSQYMMTGAAAPIGGAVGFGASGGDPYAGLAGAASAALLTSPRNLGNAAIFAGQKGAQYMGSSGQLPANLMRGGIGLGQQSDPGFQTEQLPPGNLQPFLDPFPLPTASPLDMPTGMRLIPKEDYWTPR
jgi:hypothetical protein